MKDDAPAGCEAAGNFHRDLLERIATLLLAGIDGKKTAELFQQYVDQIARDSEQWRALYERFYREQLELLQQLVEAPAGGTAAPAVHDDARFRAPEWREPYFAYLAHSYLSVSRWFEDVVERIDAEPHAKRRYAFLMRQFVDAMSPANFFWSNPAAIKEAIATGGASLAQGLKNLAADTGKGMVSTTDESVFEPGRNLAMTPGGVIFENDYLQLIEYEASTPRVFKRPLLIVPPCINKYYILDLQPENSFVRHAVNQGLRVFMISWRNIPASMGRTTWDDYLQHGIMEAMRVVRGISRADKINTLGFCVGGTLLATALAVTSARGNQPVASLTLLTTLLDYSDTGDLAVYIDASSVAQRERDCAAGGVLPGRDLALAFASLRPNDLVWRYVVNNYLLGRTPEALDLLHWNADSTNLPGAMYAYYLRNMYLENNLCQPGRLTMCGTPVDLSRLVMPTYVLATRGDHIVPWKTAYAGARLPGGKVEFVLASSGHIAGVINPPGADRRSFWTNAALPPDPQEWLAQSTSHTGSWWPHWIDWLIPHAGASVRAAQALGSRAYPVIERAPGRYVKEKADEQLVR